MLRDKNQWPFGLRVGFVDGALPPIEGPRIAFLIVNGEVMEFYGLFVQLLRDLLNR